MTTTQHIPIIVLFALGLAVLASALQGPTAHRRLPGATQINVVASIVRTQQQQPLRSSSSPVYNEIVSGHPQQQQQRQQQQQQPFTSQNYQEFKWQLQERQSQQWNARWREASTVFGTVRALEAAAKNRATAAAAKCYDLRHDDYDTTATGLLFESSGAASSAEDDLLITAARILGKTVGQFFGGVTVTPENFVN